jgi:hypothetical protein
MLSQLRFQGLRHRLRLASWQDLRQVADEALNAGIYTPSLVDAALDAGEWLHEIGAAFEKSLKELEITLPRSEDDCCWALLDYHVSQIATGLTTPLDGLKGLMEVDSGYGLYDWSVGNIGYSHDSHELIEAYWQYDELLEQPQEATYNNLRGADAIAALDQWVVTLCARWLERHAQRYCDAHETDRDSGNFCGTKQ